MSCFLRQAQDRGFSDPLIGLKITKTGLAQLCPNVFSCCKRPHSNTIAAGVYVCDIDARLRNVQALLDQYKEIWGLPFDQFELKSQSFFSQYFNYLCGKGRENPSKGQIFQSKSPEKKASPYIWLMAIIAAWRFSSEVHVVTLGKTKADQLLPKGSINESGQVRPIVFVDQKEPLRIPHIEFDFELLVNWCEGSLSPLWIDVLSENFERKSSPFSTEVEAQFRKRIDRFRNSPPLSWVYADTGSRLRNVSIGYERYS